MRQECVSLRDRPIRPWRSRSDNIRRQPAMWPKSIFRLTDAQRYVVIEIPRSSRNLAAGQKSRQDSLAMITSQNHEREQR